MLFLYDAALTLALLLAFPYLLPKVLLGRHGLKERLGLWPRGIFQTQRSAPLIWVHAASVGEVHGLAAFLPTLRREFPQHRCILSVTTRAGKERAAHLGQEIPNTFYLPVDLSFLTKRLLGRVHPSVLLLTETELWPNLIIQARRMGVKVALINGRMSAGSFSRYRIFRRLMEPVLASMDLFCVQSERDARRYRSLGAKAPRVRVTGNFKGDLLAAGGMRGDRDTIRRTLGISSRSQVLVAGSTRPGEEKEIVKAALNLRQENGSFRAIVAPRHVKRAPKLIRLMRQKGLVVVRYSQLEDRPRAPWDILVVDTLGQLMRLYAAADVAFVGGSLLPYGGHNPLEPASYGIPVLFGPHMEHCHRSAHALLQAGAGIQVADGDELREVASRLLWSQDERRRRGQASRHVVLRGAGASQRTVDALKETVL